MDEQVERRVITLKDIAEEARVSVSTVSRILDDRTPPSKSATAQRVRSIAHELGYRRNVFASSLRRGATGTIGVLVPRLTDAVMGLMFEAIERAARQRGHFAVVATCGDDADDEAQAAETLLDRNVDGLVLSTARIDDRLPQSLRERGIPHVLALRTDRISPSSLGDDDAGGYLAVRHLIDLGHRDIAVITGPWFTSSGQDRQKGAIRALEEAHLNIPDHNLRSAGYGVEDGFRTAAEVLQRSDRPTAIFAANDNLAIGVQTAAQKLGLEVGRDLSIVGYNDIPLASQLPVPLTTVHTAFDQIAANALELLLARDGDRARIRHALPTLIPRNSSSHPQQ